MMTFRTYYNSRSIRLVKTIIKNEDLHVILNVFTDALGDDIIEVKGKREDIKTLKAIYETVA